MIFILHPRFSIELRKLDHVKTYKHFIFEINRYLLLFFIILVKVNLSSRLKCIEDCNTFFSLKYFLHLVASEVSWILAWFPELYDEKNVQNIVLSLEWKKNFSNAIPRALYRWGNLCNKCKWFFYSLQEFFNITSYYLESSPIRRIIALACRREVSSFQISVKTPKIPTIRWKLRKSLRATGIVNKRDVFQFPFGSFYSLTFKYLCEKYESSSSSPS